MSAGTSTLESSDDKRSSIAWSSLFSVAVTLMALGVPILYLIGLAFDQGYQSVFRVPEVARSSGFHETLTLGFFAIQYALRFLNDWMRSNWQLMAAYAVAVGILSAAALWWSPAWLRQPQQKLRAWFRSHRNVAKASVTAAMSLITFGLPYIAVAVTWIVLSMPLLSHRIGQEVAIRNLAKHAPTCEIAAAEPFRYHQCLTAKKGAELVSGYLIAATPNYFVISLNGRTRAIPSEGWEFESTYTAAPQSAALGR